MSRKDANARNKEEKRTVFNILETELCSDSLILTELDSCRQSAQLGER